MYYQQKTKESKVLSSLLAYRRGLVEEARQERADLIRAIWARSSTRAELAIKGERLKFLDLRIVATDDLIRIESK